MYSERFVRLDFEKPLKPLKPLISLHYVKILIKLSTLGWIRFFWIDRDFLDRDPGFFG
jgi:hypothetical protein